MTSKTESLTMLLKQIPLPVSYNYQYVIFPRNKWDEWWAGVEKVLDSPSEDDYIEGGGNDAD